MLLSTSSPSDDTTFDVDVDDSVDIDSLTRTFLLKMTNPNDIDTINETDVSSTVNTIEHISSMTTTAITTALATVTATTTAAPSPIVAWLSSGRVQIPLYTTILLLAVIGNSLVILTLVQNRRMRTITNVFLLNLAVSDILLGVLCMPFTLVGMLLRDFVFGEIMCKFLPYLQGE